MRGTAPLLLGLAFLASGCRQSAVEEISGAGTPTSDSIGVFEVVPALGSAVAAGRPLTISALARYQLASAKTGAVTLSVYDESGVLLKQPVGLAVRTGDGWAHINDVVAIPGIGSSTIKITYALLPEGTSQSNVFISYVYPVS
jgi:hypothetical protein